LDGHSYCSYGNFVLNSTRCPVTIFSTQ
jgi:hypothetical protein